jgi:hypothetical protein
VLEDGASTQISEAGPISGHPPARLTKWMVVSGCADILPWGRRDAGMVLGGP